MAPYRSRLPKHLIEFARARGFDASVLVPSAVGVPPATRVSDQQSEEEVERLFQDSQDIAEQDEPAAAG